MVAGTAQMVAGAGCDITCLVRNAHHCRAWQRTGAIYICVVLISAPAYKKARTVLAPGFSPPSPMALVLPVPGIPANGFVQ